VLISGDDPVVVVVASLIMVPSSPSSLCTSPFAAILLALHLPWEPWFPLSSSEVRSSKRRRRGN